MKSNCVKLVATLASTLCLAAAAQAQNVIVRSLDANEAAKVRAAIEASMQGASRGQRVGMVSGALNPQEQVARGGMVRQELDASTLMFSVARVNAQGQVEKLCINNLDAAHAAVAAPAFAKRLSQSSKERANVTK